MNPNSSLLREKLGAVNFLLIAALGRVYDKIVFQHFLPILMWVFFLFTQCVGVTQLVYGFLSEGGVPCVAVNLVCAWGEVSLGDSYVAIMDQNNQHYF